MKALYRVNKQNIVLKFIDKPFHVGEISQYKDRRKGNHQLVAMVMFEKHKKLIL